MLNYKEVILNGVGFKCFYNKQENFLLLQIGKSHYIKINNKYLTIKTKKNKILLLCDSSDKLGNFVSKLVTFKKPDSYKNIGIVEKGKFYNKKQGKRR